MGVVHSFECVRSSRELLCGRGAKVQKQLSKSIELLKKSQLKCERVDLIFQKHRFLDGLRRVTAGRGGTN